MELTIEQHLAGYQVLKGTGGTLVQYLEEALQESERIPLLLDLLRSGSTEEGPNAFEVLVCIYTFGIEDVERVKQDLMGALGAIGLHPLSLLLACNRSNHPVYQTLVPAFERSAIPLMAVPDLSDPPDIHNWCLETPLDRVADGVVSISTLQLFKDGVPNLVELGNQWQVVGDLNLFFLERLRRIGDKIWIFGDVDLVGLPMLEDIGQEVHILGDLRIVDCPSLRRFPLDLKVEGDLYVDDEVLTSTSALELGGQTFRTRQWLSRKGKSRIAKCPSDVLGLLSAMDP